jgi:hypothetical protein
MFLSTYYRLGCIKLLGLWTSLYLAVLVPCTKVSEKDKSYQDVHIGVCLTL